MALADHGGGHKFRRRGLGNVVRQQLGELVVCAVAAKELLRRRIHKCDELLLRTEHGCRAHGKQCAERVDDVRIAHFPIPPEMY